MQDKKYFGGKIMNEENYDMDEFNKQIKKLEFNLLQVQKTIANTVLPEVGKLEERLKKLESFFSAQMNETIQRSKEDKPTNEICPKCKKETRVNFQYHSICEGADCDWHIKRGEKPKDSETLNHPVHIISDLNKKIERLKGEKTVMLEEIYKQESIIDQLKEDNIQIQDELLKAHKKLMHK